MHSWLSPSSPVYPQAWIFRYCPRSRPGHFEKKMKVAEEDIWKISQMSLASASSAPKPDPHAPIEFSLIHTKSAETTSSDF